MPFYYTRQFLKALTLQFSLVLLISCGNNESNPSGPSLSQYSDLISTAKEQVVIARGQQFTRPVQIGILSRKQYSDYNKKRSSNNESLITREFKQIGFIPDDFTDTTYASSFDDEFASAFYAPGTDSLYIIDAELSERDTLLKTIIHELTHALQEQNFNPFANDVFPTYNQSSLNSDFYISQRCIYEGDASFTENYAYYSMLHNAAAFQTIKMAYDNECNNYFEYIKLFDIPRYQGVSGYAPYYVGTRFIINAFGKDGWKSVNALYHANRVNSTADIINLSYTNPYIFDFSKITPLLLSNTTKLVLADDDTYGPLMLMGLLNEYIDIDNCKKALGWQGDHLVYTLSDNNAFGSFVWAMKFATTQDALYIKGIIDKFLSSRTLSGIAATRHSSADTITFTSTNTSTVLVQSDTKIFWLENVKQQDSILSLLNSNGGLLKSQAVKCYATISSNDKQKFLSKYFGWKTHF